MSENGDLSFSELRCKEVINAMDGKRLGRIVDILFSGETGRVKGIVVPMQRRTIFSKSQEIYIPWKCVQKIGEDVILVALVMDNCGRMSCDRPPRHDCCDDDYCPPPNCCEDDCCPPPNHGCPPPNHGCPPPNCGEDDCCPPPNRGCSPPNHCDCPPPKKGCTPPDFPNCDRRCEKCMLFDCAYRWSNY